MTNYSGLLEQLDPIVRAAGDAIMDAYCAGPEARLKCDGSPVTIADERAEKIVLAGLAECAPDIPVVSEENAVSHLMEPPERYFLVDPLDGTKEFLKSDGEGNFTVNIGLIENGVPTFGMIYVPASQRLFYGALEVGAFEDANPINVRKVPMTGVVAVASRSHLSAETEDWLRANKIDEMLSIGSSLKFCLLARGDADVYPRFSPTMEWDTAAGHAILSAAGGKMVQPNGDRFEYGKPEFRNNEFVAWGSA